MAKARAVLWMLLVNTWIDAAMRQASLRPMTVADLDNVFQLRNHIEIRRYMLTQHEISIQEHTQWFKRVSQNPCLELMVFELGKVCYGFVQFKETTFHGVMDWGFYTAPDAPKGTGRKLGLSALSHAFKNEKVHKICGQALRWNHPSIEFHKSLGFTQEGVLRDQHFDGAAYHDLICFGLLKREWVAKESLSGLKK
jgi:UDP-4-amino-4,6-dideoxy-N-acetyl-beta-L-altrosamine N-acetyltransferase